MTLGLNNMMNMGGYGINSFGMGGCNFFTNCDGTMNTNAMLGYGLTTAGLNLGMSIFNCYRGGGAGKSKKEDPEKTELNNLTKAINKQLDKLKKGISEEAGLAYEVETKYTTAIEDATTKKSTAETQKNKLGDTEVKVGNSNKKIKDLSNDDVSKLNSADKTSYSKYKKLLEDLEDGGKYGQAIKKATEAKTAREKEINEIKEEIKSLQAERDAIEDRIQAEQDAKVLDKADGHRYQQSSKEEIDKKLQFDTDGNVTWKATHNKKIKEKGVEKDKTVDNKVSKNDIRYVIQQFKDAHAVNGREAEMKKWANALKTLWDNADTDIRSDKTLQSAYNIMYEYMN